MTNSIIDSVGLNEYLRIRADASRVITKFTATLENTEKKKLRDLSRSRDDSFGLRLRFHGTMFDEPATSQHLVHQPHDPFDLEPVINITASSASCSSAVAKPFLLYPRSTVSRILRFLVRVPRHVTPNVQ